MNEQVTLTVPESSIMWTASKRAHQVLRLMYARTKLVCEPRNEPVSIVVEDGAAIIKTSAPKWQGVEIAVWPDGSLEWCSEQSASRIYFEFTEAELASGSGAVAKRYLYLALYTGLGGPISGSVEAADLASAREIVERDGAKWHDIGLDVLGLDQDSDSIDHDIEAALEGWTQESSVVTSDGYLIYSAPKTPIVENGYRFFVGLHTDQRSDGGHLPKYDGWYCEPEDYDGGQGLWSDPFATFAQAKAFADWRAFEDTALPRYA